MPPPLPDIDRAIAEGHIARARSLLGAAEGGPFGQAGDIVLLQGLAERYIQLGLFREADGLYQKALKLAPNDAGLLYNAATAAVALGKMKEAELWLDKVITARPGDYDAYYNRATLRRWGEDDNHIEAMEQLLKAGIPDHKGAVQLFYALAKEYEDLGKPEQSFGHLQRGANLRASMMRYDVRQDVETMAKIAEVFTPHSRHIPATDSGIYDTDSATLSTTNATPENRTKLVFIVGLPRTGTTLVDRILSSHTEVASLGEISDLASTIVRLAGPVQNRMELIEKSAEINIVSLSKQYAKSTSERGLDAPVLIDKTPANFLYLGIIARAMPDARIVHLKRHPLDACYAIYKTLFRMGYPYSYRLDQLADYYIAYEKLMTHWHEVMPGQILDLQYENLVQDTEAEARKLLAHCGLEWQDGVLAFHENTSPSATASAAQVRRPVYSSSIGRWRDHAAGLEPLIERLATAGIALDEVAA
ncbi:sulfotransferase [Kordiimonas sp.]|uniref:tetratricopeptide repeat-containing sulfotransferase family protein n=1 Tax=Kordiimonas sp. TaxID=1970157 RepID=UPI003B525536